MNSNLNSEERESLKENTPLMRFGTALEVAYSILFLASEESCFIQDKY